MAKVSLRRRRGTKLQSRGWFNDHPLLQMIFLGMLLVSIGLFGGLAIGFMNASVVTDSKPPSDGISHLRAGGLSADFPVVGDVTADKSRSMEDRKRLFMARKSSIASKGAFPYYPDNGKLVEPDHDFSRFSALGGSRFEEWKHGDSPYAYEQGESDDLARSRRFHVKKAMQFAWSAYETYAFGMDELKPESKSGANGWGGFGTTLVDSLDTLWLMDMKEEFQKARDWVESSLNHNHNKMVSVFETTIRSLGGLLSAYDWSGDEVFLDSAHDLGKRLFRAVSKSPTGLPFGQVNLQNGEAHNIHWLGDNVVTAEFGTIQIEFRMLARLTGNHDFKDKTEKIFEIMRDMHPKDGLYPYSVSNRGASPRFTNDKLTFGAMSDSFYEYMLKLWLQGGRTEEIYREMYDDAIQGMHDHLLQVSSPSELVFIADKNNGRLDTKMDHLVCFMGGLLALGAYTDPQGLDSERAQRDLKSAKVTFINSLFVQMILGT